MEFHIGMFYHLVCRFDREGRLTVLYFRVDSTWATEFYFLEPAALHSINVIN